jgi:hypothetical protein
MCKLTAITLFVILCCESVQPIKYKLLYKKTDVQVGSYKHAGCIVSVDECLGEKQFRQLVCEVVKNEKLFGHTSIMISVHYKLSEYEPGGVDYASSGSERKVDLLGAYSWTSGQDARPDLIMIANPNCRSINGSRKRFDHTVECGY